MIESMHLNSVLQIFKNIKTPLLFSDSTKDKMFATLIIGLDISVKGPLESVKN